jgi:alkylhydroperoxidase family enzyme
VTAELLETVRAAVDAAYNCGCPDCEAVHEERVAAVDQLAALLEVHRATFLAAARCEVGALAEAALADFERDALQYANPGHAPEDAQATEGTETC